MQSRAFHTKQMAGTGVAAAFNWDTSAASSSATWGGSSFGTPSSISGFSTTGGPLISDTGMHKKVCTSVKEVAANVDKNAQFRPYMEDEYCVRDGFAGNKEIGMFAIFDGHGGKQASEYCAERVPQELAKELKKGSKDLFKSFDTVFVKINDELRLIDAETAGTTAVVCLVLKEYGNPVIYTANVGDSRAVLKHGKSGAIRLSTDHRPCERPELERIAKAGGVIMGGRVGGSLAITRALGDHILYKSGVIPNPSISRHEVKRTDTYLIIASDGVWDALSDEQIVALVDEERGADYNVKLIIKEALMRGSKDNISCIAVHL